MIWTGLYTAKQAFANMLFRYGNADKRLIMLMKLIVPEVS